MSRQPGNRFAARLIDVQTGSVEDSYRSVQLKTERGAVATRYYEATGARQAVICVGGVGGGWDSPAHGLYPRLLEELTRSGIAGLRVRFRESTVLDEAIHDVLAGITFLLGEGFEQIGLIGHSFGGAVVIQAAEASENVRTVVTLATQSYGALPVSDLAAGCSILLIHGTIDPILPYSSSEYVYQIAKEPKRLILHDGAGHTLDEVSKEVYAEVKDWITSELGGS